MERGNGTNRIDLVRILEVLTAHITQSLCETTFKRVRNRERQRQWSLFALVQFWLAVILRAPPSLSHALVEMREGREPLVPRIKASDEAFFQRCRDLSWEFFAEVLRRFVASLKGYIEPRFCSELSFLRKRFSDVLVIDGSKLAAIAHKLKILWDERSVILPGCLIGVYDLFRGIPRVLEFCVDAAASELTRARKVLSKIERGTLIIGDRLYCTAIFFAELRNKRLFGLFRRNKSLGLCKVGNKPMRKKRCRGGVLLEWLVEAGSGQSAPIQRLRLIRFKKGRKVYELLTNVLDMHRLSAEEALDLYPCRWSIERMYFDLKEVLNLNRLYPANPNAVGMQVCAGALVYTAMRVAQGEVAHEAGIEPEEISPAKFFPKMAASCHDYILTQYVVGEMVRLNPGKRLRKPKMKGRRFTSVSLDDILVHRREGLRRKRRYCKARQQWKSFTHIRGGAKLT